MKATFIAIALSLVGSALYAQDFSVTAPTERKIEPNAVVVTPKPSIEGIVKEIFVTKKPWQMINPAAPASYGSGQKNVSKDHGPGTPYHSSGWIVAGVEW